MNLVAVSCGFLGIGLMSFGLWRAIRDASLIGRVSSFALHVQLRGMGLFLAAVGEYLIGLSLAITTVVGIILILQGVAIALGGPWLFLRNRSR